MTEVFPAVFFLKGVRLSARYSQIKSLSVAQTKLASVGAKKFKAHDPCRSQTCHLCMSSHLPQDKTFVKVVDELGTTPEVLLKSPSMGTKYTPVNRKHPSV